MHKMIAVLSVLTMGQAMAADVSPTIQRGSTQPLGPQTLTRPAATLTFSNNWEDRPLLVITADGVVTRGGVPLDELPPAEQIAAMCAALSSLALNGAGVTVRRCGKPAP